MACVLISDGHCSINYLHGVEHDLSGLEAHELPAGGEDVARDEHLEEEEALQQEGAQAAGRVARCLLQLLLLVQPLPRVLVVALVHLLQQRQQARHQAPLEEWRQSFQIWKNRTAIKQWETVP